MDYRSILKGLIVSGFLILTIITGCLIFSSSFRMKLMPEGLFSMNLDLIVAYILVFICSICAPIVLLLRKKK